MQTFTGALEGKRRGVCVGRGVSATTIALARGSFTGCARELGRYVWVRWRADELHKLRTLAAARASVTSRDDCLKALDELRSALHGARAMDARLPIVVDPRLSLGEPEYPGGLQLQVTPLPSL